MHHFDCRGINHEGCDPKLCEFFPRLVHLTSFHGGLVTVIGEEKKRATPVENLTHRSGSFKDRVSVLKA